MEVQLFHEDGRTDTTKLTADFCSFANVPKKNKFYILQTTYQASAAIHNIPEERGSHRQQQATSRSKLISSASILVSPFLNLTA
jgi:hypothetical protein